MNPSNPLHGNISSIADLSELKLSQRAVLGKVVRTQEKSGGEHFWDCIQSSP